MKVELGYCLSIEAVLIPSNLPCTSTQGPVYKTNIKKLVQLTHVEVTFVLLTLVTNLI